MGSNIKTFESFLGIKSKREKYADARKKSEEEKAISIQNKNNEILSNQPANITDLISRIVSGDMKIIEIKKDNKFKLDDGTKLQIKNLGMRQIDGYLYIYNDEKVDEYNITDSQYDGLISTIEEYDKEW